MTTPNTWSPASEAVLATVDPRLRRVADYVLPHWNCTAIEGARSDERQKLLFAQGKSHLDGVTQKSKHQVGGGQSLSLALDLAPWYPDLKIPWERADLFRAFASFVLGVAAAKRVRLRWGGDWDGDHRFRDQTFHDLPHFELL